MGSGAARRRSVTGAPQSRAPLAARRRASPPAVSVSNLGPSSTRQPRTLHQDLLASCRIRYSLAWIFIIICQQKFRAKIKACRRTRALMRLHRDTELLNAVTQMIHRIIIMLKVVSDKLRSVFQHYK